MSEMREQPQSQPEAVQPLELSLSPDAQRGLFSVLHRTLMTDTTNEVERSLPPEAVRELDAMRGIFTQVANNLNEYEVSPTVALYMGIADFIPAGQLEEWASQTPTNYQEQQIRQYARHLLGKMQQQE